MISKHVCATPGDLLVPKRYRAIAPTYEGAGYPQPQGWVGKTTLAIHMAVLADQAGLRTLLIDLDPQRSAASWWRARAAETPHLETEPVTCGTSWKPLLKTVSTLSSWTPAPRTKLTPLMSPPWLILCWCRPGRRSSTSARSSARWTS
jgi:hypothetical protein